MAEADDRVAEACCHHTRRELRGISVVVPGRALCGPVGVALFRVGDEILCINDLVPGGVSRHPRHKGLVGIRDPGVHPVGPSRVGVGEGLDAVVVDPGVQKVLRELGGYGFVGDARGLRVACLNQ